VVPHAVARSDAAKHSLQKLREVKKGENCTTERAKDGDCPLMGLNEVAAKRDESSSELVGAFAKVKIPPKGMGGEVAGLGGN